MATPQINYGRFLTTFLLQILCCNLKIGPVSPATMNINRPGRYPRSFPTSTGNALVIPVHSIWPPNCVWEIRAIDRLGHPDNQTKNFIVLNVSKPPRLALQNPIQFYIWEIRVTNRLGRPDNQIKNFKKKLHIFKRFKVTPQTPSQPVTPVSLTKFSVTKSTGRPGRPPPTSHTVSDQSNRLH